jgi:SAM-dependent methyltransferase
VDGIPILLRDDVEHCHWAATRTLELSDDVLVNGAGEACEMGVHPFVQTAIEGTNGIMYRSLVGNLSSYPIPFLCAVPTSGTRFLDIGCNWGRWCIAACRAGFVTVGIDPSYEAVHAARAVARQLRAEAQFVVADARHLPFRRESFDFAFSYSVLQHLPKAQVRESLSAIRRVLRPDGRAMVQMPNQFGIRSLYHQLRRRFRDAKAFEVRYWSVCELEEVFTELIGLTETRVDGFFSLNVQPSDRPLLPARYRAVITVSESLRKLSETVTGLRYLADSIYVSSRKSYP